MDLLLGLDLGTTNCKVLAMDPSGRIVASVTAPTPDRHNANELHSAEYDADDLWRLFAQLLRSLHVKIAQAALRPSSAPLPSAPSASALPRIAGLCVSSMGESGVLLDAAGQACAPVIVWHDLRTKPYLQYWQARLSPTQLYQRTGLSIDHIYSASKLIWHREHTPAAFARATQWLGLADWLTFKLTGVPSVSLSMASRTMLFDPSTRTWSDDMLALAGIPSHLMPPLVTSGAVVGHVTAEAARQTLLPQGIPVSAGGHDHICGAIAVGAITPGISVGSSPSASMVK